jgi:hypothetical protein
MPAGVSSSPVAGLGSGKLGIPWARRQRDTARSFCSSWVLTCWGGVVGGPYFAQARCGCSAASFVPGRSPAAASRCE